jgi:hypothetical protein
VPATTKDRDRRDHDHRPLRDGIAADHVAGNLGESSRALACDPASTVSIRNSFLVAIDDGTPEIDCASANASNSASENALPGNGNATLGDIQAGWFVDLTDDFHLHSPPAAVSTTGRWQHGDPLVDIDGDPRPALAEGPDHVGADAP